MPRLDDNPPKKQATRKATKKATKNPSNKVVPLTPAEVSKDQEDTKESAGKPAKKAAARKRPPRSKDISSAGPASALLAKSTKLFTPDPSLLTPLGSADNWVRCLIYGDGGVGKTSSWASLTQGGHVWAVDTENGIRPEALLAFSDDIDVDLISRWGDWSYSGLRQLHVTAKAQLADHPGSIHAIVIDTTTALSGYWVEETVLEAMARPDMQRKHPNRETWETFQDDYGVLAQKMQAVIVRELMSLDCHVVLVAHARRSENEAGQLKIGPALTPAVAQIFNTNCDMVLNLSIDKGGKRVVRAAPQGQIEAKDRYGMLPDSSDEVDLWSIFQRVGAS